MKKALIIFAAAVMMLVCGCSRTFTIAKEDSALNRQNIKILNNSCKSGESLIYLKNDKVLKVENLSLDKDSLSYIESIPGNVRVISCMEVKKIVTRDGAGSFIQGLGFGAALGFAGLLAGAASTPSGSGHGTGLPTSWVVGPAAGLVIGFAAGELIGADKIFIFTDSNETKVLK